MTSVILESIAKSIRFGDLPEIWRHSLDEYRFSEQKSLFDYQQEALNLAARVLHLYFGASEDENLILQAGIAGHASKANLFRQYIQHRVEDLDICKYDSAARKRAGSENPVFEILQGYFPDYSDTIRFQELINRMGFWMATGSGKTLVMIKLIEYLHRLIDQNLIPDCKILVLAPSENLLEQIEQTIAEFNQSGLYLDFVPLVRHRQAQQGLVGDTATVYYHRSDNISDVQKEVLIDFKRYENGGKWYVFLDEAHKGSKDDSKRQAYYSVMARNGFLFNFSATFTDAQDIATTVKKFNLEEFVSEGYGKKILLNQQEFNSFRKSDAELSHFERQKVVLKAMVNLAVVSICVQEIRQVTGNVSLYHLPLMVTLVNTVNTSIEKEKNDLWTFFRTLRQIAAGDFDSELFEAAKKELIQEWKNTNYLFGASESADLDDCCDVILNLSMLDLCGEVFLSREHGALQIVSSSDNKEIALQMKNADAPFALIRIGQTANWRTNLLHGYEETKTLKESSYFSKLESSSITILMGSRSFFEGWDSNRPNIINFINIGGSGAKKFVVQSVGRGVRIEPVQSRRRRRQFLPENSVFEKVRALTAPVETLFLYATNRKAIQTVLEGLKQEKTGKYEIIEGFSKAEIPALNGDRMVLLVPKYAAVNASKELSYAQFTMSGSTLNRLQRYLKSTPDSVFLVRHGLTPEGLQSLKQYADPARIQEASRKDYPSIEFLLLRLLSHMDIAEKNADGVRELDEDADIVHFRNIRTRLSRDEAKDLSETITRVSQGQISAEEQRSLALQFAKNEISFEDFQKRISGASELTYRNLRIKHVQKHYYLPLVMKHSDNGDVIQHIVKQQSEIDFLNGLEKWLSANPLEWDAWMFSKIDEYLDKIHIPYYNSDANDYSNFVPDFIFWMCKGSDYQIVFVDPKGTVHKSAYLKIDGFVHLFEKNHQPADFTCNGLNVRVKLLLFNEDSSVPHLYRRFWTTSYERIFA